MNEIILLSLFLVIGYLTGVFAGMLGIGGGIIFFPVLVNLLKYTPVDLNQIIFIAIGTSLFAGSFATISSGSNHYIAKNVDLKKALLLAGGSVTASFIAPFFVVNITPEMVKIILTAIFISLAVKMFLENGTKLSFKVNTSPKEIYLIGFGLIIGTLSAFSGIGGGILFVPILMYLYFFDIKKAIGTSAVVTACTMISSALSYAVKDTQGISIDYQLGYIYILAGVPLGISSIFGALKGVKITLNSSSGIIKKIFSLLLIIAVIEIIFQL